MKKHNWHHPTNIDTNINTNISNIIMHVYVSCMMMLSTCLYLHHYCWSWLSAAYELMSILCMDNGCTLYLRFIISKFGIDIKWICTVSCILHFLSLPGNWIIIIYLICWLEHHHFLMQLVFLEWIKDWENFYGMLTITMK